MFSLVIFRTNARLSIRIHFISTGTGTAVTACIVRAVMIAVRRYMQLEIQRTCQRGKKVPGSEALTIETRNCDRLIYKYKHKLEIELVELAIGVLGSFPLDQKVRFAILRNFQRKM